jgi:hypothetical protein
MLKNMGKKENLDIQSHKRKICPLSIFARLSKTMEI